MKIFIASDIHGSLAYALRLNDRILLEKPDKVILLGDLYYHGPRNPLPYGYDPMGTAALIKAMKPAPLIIRGNCDAEVDEMITGRPFKRSTTLNILGKKVFFTHGHRFNPENPPDNSSDIIFYGHTHINGFIEKDSRLYVNCGSPSLPKNGSERSYALIDGNIAYIKSLEGSIIGSRQL